MTGELPRPEIEKTPEARFFDVEAMSDEQVMILWRVLAETSYGFYKECGPAHGPNNPPSPAEQAAEQDLNLCDGLWENLVRETGALVDRDPERVKHLVRGCALSLAGSCREFAARVAPSLATYDYPFARDVLIAMAVSGHYCVTGMDMWSDVAIEKFTDFEQRLSPDQRADFNERYGFYRDRTDWSTPDF